MSESFDTHCLVTYGHTRSYYMGRKRFLHAPALSNLHFDLAVFSSPPPSAQALGSLGPCARLRAHSHPHPHAHKGLNYAVMRVLLGTEVHPYASPNIHLGRKSQERIEDHLSDFSEAFVKTPSRRKDSPPTGLCRRAIPCPTAEASQEHAQNYVDSSN